MTFSEACSSRGAPSITLRSFKIKSLIKSKAKTDTFFVVFSANHYELFNQGDEWQSCNPQTNTTRRVTSWRKCHLLSVIYITQRFFQRLGTASEHSIYVHFGHWLPSAIRAVRPFQLSVGWVAKPSKEAEVSAVHERSHSFTFGVLFIRQTRNIPAKTK
jgi:hypothetical protein